MTQENQKRNMQRSSRNKKKHSGQRDETKDELNTIARELIVVEQVWVNAEFTEALISSKRTMLLGGCPLLELSTPAASVNPSAPLVLRASPLRLGDAGLVSLT